MSPLILWDFDGTLAYRDGGMWSAALTTVINEARGHHQTVCADDFKPYLSAGFPWHTPDIVHNHIRHPDQWWAELSGVLTHAIRSVCNIKDNEIIKLLPAIRSTYTDPHFWRVFPDVVFCLKSLSSLGFKHHVLSNHVPELGRLVQDLKLDSYFERVFSSAVIGYEKPHPRAFEIALDGHDPHSSWMIGDNLVADIEGAAACGIRGILVRKEDVDTAFSFSTLAQIPDFITHFA